MKLNEFFNIPLDRKEKKFPSYPGQSEEEQGKLEDDLFWYILDNDDLHKEFVLPFISDLKTAIDSPEFSKNRFSKKWYPMIRKGCHSFYKKKKMSADPKDLFGQELIQNLSDRLTNKFVTDIKDDQYYIGKHQK